MTTEIDIRRDTAANWTSNNPTLALGEMGFETDTRKLKVGDGATAWTSLLYILSGASDSAVREIVGPTSYPMSSPNMKQWALAMGAAPDRPARLFRIADSLGQEFSDSWGPCNRQMARALGYPRQGGGLFNIGSGFGWPTIQGTMLLNRGITCAAQQMTSNQICTSGLAWFDGVLFMWLDDAGGSATGLQLMVDGSVVQTVDSRSKGQYYYALPGGLGSHTISYKNNGVSSVTVDSAYLYLGNRTTGLQIWEASHVGITTKQYSDNIDIPYYLNLLQPSCIHICTGINDRGAGPTLYINAVQDLYDKSIAQITYKPSWVLWMPYGVNAWDMSPQEAVAKEFCADNDVAFVNSFKTIGSIPGGSGADPQGFTGDRIHPTGYTINAFISPENYAVLGVGFLDETYLRPNDAYVVTGTSYTATGYERVLVCDNASPIAVSIYSPSIMALVARKFQSGSRLRIIQAGAGKVTVTQSDGTPSFAPGGSASTNGPGSYIELTPSNSVADQWVISSSPCPTHVAVLSLAGTLTTGLKTPRVYLPAAATILDVTLSVGTAPTGADLRVNVRYDGTNSIWTAGYLAMTAAAYVARTSTINHPAITTANWLQLDITQVGSTVAGADLVVTVRYTMP